MVKFGLWPKVGRPGFSWESLCHPWDSPGTNTGVGCHVLLQCMKVKSESEVAQSCPTLSDPMDCSLPGFSVRWIFQARVLEWGAIAFSGEGFYIHIIVTAWSWTQPSCPHLQNRNKMCSKSNPKHPAAIRNHQPVLQRITGDCKERKI